MNLKGLLLASVLVFSGIVAKAQSNDQVQAYLAKFKDIAMAEQKRVGVPAAITLAQGIHESACGKSELCTNARNHFGIKCKSNWQGDTYTYTDDAKDECFRKYTDDEHSYKDHSDFLKNSTRYASLFALDITDYKAWASGLKKAGYATNPNYTKCLVDLIEKYNLQQYTLKAENGGFGDDEAALEEARELQNVDKSNYTFANDYPQEEIAYYVNTEKNGLKGFWGKKGDLLLNAAYKNNIRYAKLLELNDLADEPLAADMFIYLVKKNKEGATETYTIKAHENLQMVAQEQGMRLRDLKAYNHLEGAEEPAAGTILYLQNPSPKKPLIQMPNFVKTQNSGLKKDDNKDQYIAGGKQYEYTQTGVEQAAQAVRQEVKKVEPSEETNTNTEPYTIASEVAIEDQMAAEKAAKVAPEVSSTESPAVEETPSIEEMPASEETEMSDLDRLKAKLDQSVYGNKAKPNNTSNVKNNTPEVTPKNNTYETRPASQIPSSNVSDAKINATNYTNSQDALKRRIEAHQRQEERADPVVANKSNVAVKEIATPNVKPKDTKAEAKKLAAEKAAKAKKTTAPSSYVVKKGETLTSIAEKNKLSLKELMKLNKLQNGNIKPGQKLKLK